MRRTLVGVLLVGLGLFVATVGPAHAAVVPVDPGPIAAGKPLVGSGQNLPSLGVTETYDSGPGFAEQINDYYDDGIDRDTKAVVDTASKWVKRYVQRECDGDARTCKAMVVFDVDDTLFSTYEQASAAKPAFSYDSDAWAAAVDACAQPLITPVAELFTSARKMGVTVAILTGRSQEQRDETVTCLRKAGVTGWYELITRDSKNENLSAADYKSQQRAVWERKGFTIIASVGDQVSDMAKGYLLKGFLLPNPMYFIP